MAEYKSSYCNYRIPGSLAIIAYRIYGNIQANNERANRVSQGQNIAVATSFPQRQSITPVMRLRAALILFGRPTWQLK